MSYKLAVLLVQNFHGMSLSLSLLGYAVNPVNDYGHGRKFLDKLVRHEKQSADHRPLIKTRSDFSIGSHSYVLIYGRNKNIIYRNNISPSIN